MCILPNHSSFSTLESAGHSRIVTNASVLIWFNLISEQISIRIQLINPLRVPLVLTDVTLLWRFLPISYDENTNVETPQMISNQALSCKVRERLIMESKTEEQMVHTMPAHLSPIKDRDSLYQKLKFLKSADLSFIIHPAPPPALRNRKVELSFGVSEFSSEF